MHVRYSLYLPFDLHKIDEAQEENNKWESHGDLKCENESMLLLDKTPNDIKWKDNKTNIRNGLRNSNSNKNNESSSPRTISAPELIANDNNKNNNIASKTARKCNSMVQLHTWELADDYLDYETIEKFKRIARRHKRKLKEKQKESMCASNDAMTVNSNNSNHFNDNYNNNNNNNSKIENERASTRLKMKNTLRREDSLAKDIQIVYTQLKRYGNLFALVTVW